MCLLPGVVKDTSNANISLHTNVQRLTLYFRARETLTL